MFFPPVQPASAFRTARPRFLPCCSVYPIPGSEDSTVKLWTLPEGGLTDGNMGAEDATADLTFNYTAVR